ncbi:hypothetical protein GlitD10_2292 [Gloeomargarita lithophora Alchichica-D10]|uniref:DNA helicase n=1 Tax=Gloeomargarita lithophora Alchichica-D10 TaxID=1188229 RepID=A0A1J0AFA7_9CYAN|nr:DEAD/DEAH box helicase family protein [Gloeomargarita lithophora]APB34625.1 hypothetical protein GlitD10_2292 [Gloeomargarita lithophora Alchichica-D10]
MYKLRFTRSAISGIQRYPDVIEAISRFCEGHFGEHKALKGGDKLLRTRQGNHRIIWTRINETTILVVKVGNRKDIYENNLGSVEQALEEMEPEELNWADLGIQVTMVENLPTYELPVNNSSLRQFFYGSYLYSPVLTDEQRKLLPNLTNFASYSQGIDSLLIQSAPGTGKTICAVLLACNLYENYEYNIILILPKNLCHDIWEYEQIKDIRAKYNNESFFVGTLEQWIESLYPELFSQIATLEEQKIALKQEAKRIHITDLNDPNENDVKLYTSFIYAIDESIKNNQERILYKQNREKIEQLSKINKTRFQANLNNKILRVDALELLSQKLIPETITPRKSTVFIVDEAQDYLLKELKLISNVMLNRWREEHQHPSLFWLLGDLNQRIQPVDFDWGDLHLNKIHSLVYNYRNSKKILEFANIFQEIAQKLTKGTKALPSASDLESGFEEGDPVKVLEVSTTYDIEKLLSKISGKTKKSEENSDRYLLKKLAEQAYVIHNRQETVNKMAQFSNINHLNVADAKGREFDGCILVLSGCNSKEYLDANNCYTAATRPRQRLLVVMTSSEIEAIGREKLGNCEFFDTSDEHLESLVTWIAQSSNAESGLKDTDVVINNIINQVPDLYFDTYSVLNFIKASDEQIHEVESTLISKLKKCDVNSLESQLKELESLRDIGDRVGLRCLILRALDRSWDAVTEAFCIKADDPQKYHRLLNAISTELESKGLPYEAARIRAKVHRKLPNEYPFSEKFPTDDHSPLVAILCKLAVNRIKSEV